MNATMIERGPINPETLKRSFQSEGYFYKHSLIGRLNIIQSLCH